MTMHGGIPLCMLKLPYVALAHSILELIYVSLSLPKVSLDHHVHPESLQNSLPIVAVKAYFWQHAYSLLTFGRVWSIIS